MSKGKRDRSGARSSGGEDSDANTRRHEKCVSGHDSDRKKSPRKKPMKKYPDEVVKFVEGTHTEPTSTAMKNSSLKKALNDIKRKAPKYNTQIRFLEHKYIQCNIVRTNSDLEVALPEEIKPLLINVTFLLHELKQRDSKNYDDMCNFISKIVTLITELSRRPFKKVDEEFDGPKPFDDISNKLATILSEHDGPDEEEYERLVRDIQALQQELIQRDSDVKYVKEQIVEEKARTFSEPKDVNDCLTNSMIKNQSLKAEIKFNKALLKRYSKLLAHKEQAKQKSDLEVNTLRKRLAKQEQSLEMKPKAVIAEGDVFHGGSLTKYIKSKVVKEKKLKRKSPSKFN